MTLNSFTCAIYPRVTVFCRKTKHTQAKNTWSTLAAPKEVRQPNRNFCIRSQSPIFHCHTTFWPFSWFERRFGLMTGDEFYGQRYLRAFNDNVIGWELCNLHSTTQLQDRILLNITQLQSQLYYRHFITNYHVMISDPTGQEYKPPWVKMISPPWVKAISPMGEEDKSPWVKTISHMGQNNKPSMGQGNKPHGWRG